MPRVNDHNEVATAAEITAGQSRKKIVAPAQLTEVLGPLINLIPGAALTADLTLITHTAPTPDYAVQALVQNTGFGFVTADEGNTVLSVIANLQTRVAELEARLIALGLIEAPE